MTPAAFDVAAKPQPLALFAADSQGNLADLFSETDESGAGE